MWRVIGEGRTSSRRGVPSKVNIVFDRERNSIERFAGRSFTLKSRRNRNKLVSAKLVNPDTIVAALGDAVEHVPNKGRGRERAGFVTRLKGRDIETILRVITAAR